MNAEQKQRAIKLITYWRNRSITTMPEEYFVSGDCMTDLLHELIDATEPEQPNQSEQHLEMVNAPAPSVPDWLETTQFLTDVTIAAGLLAYGRRDKGLARRISEFAFKYQRLAAAPERDPELVRDAERYRWLRNWTRGAYGIDSNPAFILPHVPIPTVPDQNIMRGSLAQHLDNAIDAAIEREKGGAA